MMIFDVYLIVILIPINLKICHFLLFSEDEPRLFETTMSPDLVNDLFEDVDDLEKELFDKEKEEIPDELEDEDIDTPRGKYLS